LIGVSFKAKLILVNLANPLTSRHRADITLNTLIYYLIAECFVLIKQSYNTIPCFLFFTYHRLCYIIKDINKTINRRNGSPYPEVTVASLPSSLMIVHSNAFVFSTSLLVVVSRYGSYLVKYLYIWVVIFRMIQDCYCFSRTHFTLLVKYVNDIIKPVKFWVYRYKNNHS